MSNEEKRAIYDRSGEEGVSRMGDHGGFGAHETFSSFFGDFFGGSSEQEHETPQGADVVVGLYVTLEEVQNSVNFWLEFLFTYIFSFIKEVLSK